MFTLPSFTEQFLFLRHVVFLSTGLKRKRAPGIGGSGSGSGSAHGADRGAKRKASSGSDGGGGSPKKTTKKMKQPDKPVGA